MQRTPKRTQYAPYVPDPHAHPYAHYPYAPRQNVDPRYVGPQWAAPAPYQTPRQARVVAPARRRSGCVLPILLLVLAVIAAVPLGILVVARDFLDRAEIGVKPPPTTIPTASAPVPTATVAATPITQPEVNRSIKGGTCREVSLERDEDQYQASREGGSARHLRGKVAMLHIQLGGGQAAWPKTLTTRIDEAALLSQRFYLDQAKRYQIKDLRYDVIPWPLRDAKVQLPKLPTDAHKLLDKTTMYRLRGESQSAIEQAFGSPLESVVASYKRNGYTSVGFLVYLPVSTDARDFAFPASNGEPDQPELGILFPRTDVLDHLAVVVAHEGMHLFGADDLYRMRLADKADLHDVMGEYCLGFRQTSIDDATAYAIGWRDKPPARSYSIVDR